MRALIRYGLTAHKWLRYAAVTSLVLFSFSALMHPIMIWTGPQPVNLYPPSMSLEGISLASIQIILKKYRIESPLLIKIVPTKAGPLLQITESEVQPRRYFNLAESNEIKEFDSQQAIWLARYYTQSRDAVLAAELITSFNDDYPWVNRLLPVYKITFDSQDGTAVYVHTETNALAALSNHWKNILQTIFQSLHTWSWLDDRPVVRLALMTAMLVVLAMVLFTGIIQLFLLKSAPKRVNRRLVHRILGWVIFIPFLALLISGLFHLQYQQLAENHRGQRISSPLAIPVNLLSASSELLDKNLPPINSVSLIEYQQELYYRIGFSQKNHKHRTSQQHHGAEPANISHIRERRFDGSPSERASIYMNSKDGEISSLTDEWMAVYLAKQFFAATSTEIKKAELITHFSHEYDFRNKRLPVWKLETSMPEGHRVFVEPGTGIIVDHLVPSARWEALSFSILHKWDFLVPVAGREVRDSIVVAVLLGLFGLGYIGISLGKMRKMDLRK